ncbi:hypothetical protein [Actinoplanes derwentensis]|uniref:Uncharacterized protein n=1 Tax=Actinoplanes derwentensis TaxID=113562 RepID=A0A1H2CCI4_9ACTN|nr:hypothetical protein [Actinoplanes derwentensis]GID88189.1 hypothetical protein Ade03nite_71130 [Actinoplanes derwentensis]SDT67806.1 hypothetical protein SAMN04489716_5527 [Actinoplanes derwentensis]
MRKPALATVALVTVFLTGCSSGGSGEPAVGTATPAAAGGVTSAAAGPVASLGATPAQQTEKPTDAALSADTEAICAQAGRTSASFGKTFAEDYQLLIQAAGEGAEAKSRAQEKVSRDMANFSYALLDMSKLAADPQVKKALAAMGAEVTALKGDVAKIDDKKLAGLQGTLDKACGRQ